ncbi:MAG: DNA repair protein RecN [Lachnospiraceae bacterium]|nr:DNA repair protein RecN [Lachnospiraceae bacterium]
MLYSLKVKNIALIDETGVVFGEGLNIFTGETGAGKSLVIGALTLALGGKLPKDIVRDEEKDADIELVFSTDNKEVLKVLSDSDIDAGEDNLIIRRHISAGKSLMRLNDNAVTASLIKGITGSLIDIHGQHEHQKLLYAKNQLEILDSYAGEKLDKLMEEYHKNYVNYKELVKRLADRDADPAERLREADLLRFELEEIEKADLKPGEDEELEERFALMNNSLKLTMHATETAALIGYEDGGVSDKLSRGIRAFSEISGLDTKAGELSGQLEEIDSLLGDFRKDLDTYIGELKFSEEDFNLIRERLDLINTLKVKYGRDIEQICSAAEERSRRLSELENYDKTIEKLKADELKTRQELLSTGLKISRIRRDAAGELEKKLKEELEELNFEAVSFEINIATDEEAPGENGLDSVEFLISTNPGEKVKPLAQVASGGELSRVMLAIKTVLADSDKTDTLIFDEIDEGISGRTAQKVSESLQRIAKRHQVICITHLPQIAAMADHHFLIRKEVEDGKTRTSLKELDFEESVGELSRLLGGAQITDKVVENAREMKKLAERIKI